MKKALLNSAVFVIGLVMMFTSCKKNKTSDNEEELITTVTLAFTEQGTSNISTFIFRDSDGDGGNPPTLYQDIVLAPNKVYNLAIALTNESVNPAEDITGEVAAEAGDHQFYFEVSGVNVTINNLNTDSGGLPLGLTSRWTTTTTSTGKVKITLKHKPGIKAAGDPVAKGDTDIELDWTVKVQ
ncbi:MAG: hypothetical protein HC867_02895 [Bacteroidia bacterium]|nr:hypothetical protein [Bacteroidia bacterium]